jgi:hypothetical protein
MNDRFGELLSIVRIDRKEVLWLALQEPQAGEIAPDYPYSRGMVRVNPGPPCLRVSVTTCPLWTLVNSGSEEHLILTFILPIPNGM